MADSTRIEMWVNQMEMEIDYYSAFIKAWIPFNAWYRDNYPYLNTDREVINLIKNTGNRFRDKFGIILEEESIEGDNFRECILQLYNILPSAGIEYNLKFDKYIEEMKLSFNEIVICKNTETNIDEIKNRINYFIQRDKNNGKIKVRVSNQTTQILFKEQECYNLNELETCTEYIKLTTAQKENLKSFYISICPCVKTNLLYDENRDTRGIECRDTKFADAELLIKGLIECLYILRNALLHGEIKPDDSTKSCYEYAYNILKSVMKII